jgi:hypothetical protein
MPHSHASASNSSRRTSMQQPLLERDNSPPPHARQQWYEAAAAEAARQGQQEPGAQAGNSVEAGSDVPLVLLHGIGMGLIPYISLLFNMAATGEDWCEGWFV